MAVASRACTLLLGTLLFTSTVRADYLSDDLRTRVDELQVSLAAMPTNPANAPARAQIAWEWINAHALNGGYVPVNATQVVASVLATPERTPMLRALDATIAELAWIDSDPDAIGTLTADTGPFEAASFATITQTWTVGSQSVQTGGGFMLARHFMVNFGVWQTADPAAPNYISVESSNPKVSFVATTTPLAGMHGGFRSARETLTFRVASGTLATGDTVTLTYGDTRKGSPGMRMPTIASDRMPLPVYVAFSRNAPFFSLPIQPVRITGSTLAGVAAFAPSVVAPGEMFTLAIRGQDRFYNRATTPIPDWQLTLNDAPWLPVEATGVITEALVSIDEPGIYFIGVQSGDGALSGESNPVLVTSEQRPHIYWGDTHGHSGFAEGIGTPHRFMRWARDDARLDYVTHSEHDIWLDDAEWEVLRGLVTEYTRKDRFVAYLGYEWTVRNLSGGHHNVLFRTPDNRQRVPAQYFPTLSKLYQGLRASADPRDVVVIPHAHQAGDYRQSDPELEPLIEIMSQHGNFEWFGRMYLQHGHQVGFTAASDNHLSQPGYSAPQGGSLSQRGGLGAILADSLTPDAIFDGMKALRSYATTGDRIILDFNVNGGGMGQRIPFDETRKISGRVIGTAPIDSITIMKNGREIWRESLLDNKVDRVSKRDQFLLTFASESEPVHPGDNPRGWRTWEGTLQVENAKLLNIQPMDASFPAQTVAFDADETPDEARFQTSTRGDGSSYLLTLDDVQRNTRLQLDIVENREFGGAPPVYRAPQRVPAVSFDLAIRDISEGSLRRSQSVDAYTDTVTLRRIITGGQRQFTFEIEDTGRTQGDYYYVRVVQANDAIAWSSPVWVGGFPSR